MPASFLSVLLWRRLKAVAGLLALLLLLCACTRQTRHEVLTFFFTGVPPLETPSAAAMQASAADVAAQKQKAERGSRFSEASKAQSAPAEPEKPRYYSHPMWFEGQCDVCHEGSNLFTFQAPTAGSSAQSERVFFSGGGMPGALKMPANRLCGGCHVDKTGLRAIKDQLWLHNPTAKGDCLACHDAHQSKISGILRKPAQELCMSCHKQEALAAVSAHRLEDKPCLDCHTNHMGKDRNLLRKDYLEQGQPALRKPQDA